MTGGFVRYTRQHTQGQSLMTIEVEGGHWLASVQVTGFYVFHPELRIRWNFKCKVETTKSTYISCTYMYLMHKWKLCQLD